MPSDTASSNPATAEPTSAFTWSQVPSEPDVGIAAEDLVDEDDELPSKPTLANRILQRLDDIDTTIYRIQSEPNTLLSDLLGYMAEGQISMSDGGRRPDPPVDNSSKAHTKEVRIKLDRILVALMSEGDVIDDGASIGARVSNIESLVRILVERSLAFNPRPPVLRKDVRDLRSGRIIMTPDDNSFLQSAEDQSLSSPSRPLSCDKTSIDTEPGIAPTVADGMLTDNVSSATREAIAAAVTDGIITYLSSARLSHAFKATVSRSLSILEHIPKTEGIDMMLSFAMDDLCQANANAKGLDGRARKLLASASGRLRVALMYLKTHQEDGQGWKMGILESVIDDLDTTATMV
ncbi:hypothetical protein I350_05741 [Cryptococcus amylolentus CBS 6273]|uniref:Uncharacterized protein n=1 Tax=Cryptococcus amylolentus CBS 6273 TaxID=1296118 RepID=A0A1E3JPT0_9TREE|nr:hypothetical protein I350_05741 [Cryptococcus amylolentus CBS 6273]